MVEEMVVVVVVHHLQGLMEGGYLSGWMNGRVCQEEGTMLPKRSLATLLG